MSSAASGWSADAAPAVVPAPVRPGDGAAGTRVAFRGGGFESAANWRISVAAFVAVIAVWQIAASRPEVNSILLPSPFAIAQALYTMAADGTLWAHASISLYRIGSGWLLGTLAGLAIGLGVGVFCVVRSITLPLVASLYPIPKIALLPLFILWLGIGEAPKVAIIALGVFFPTVIAVYSGVDGVPRNLVRMAQTFNFRLRMILLDVLLPGAMPGVFAGFRISAATALLLVVSAEMIGANRGLGAFILQAGSLMRTDQLMAGVAVLSLLGIAIGTLLNAAERRLLRWR